MHDGLLVIAQYVRDLPIRRAILRLDLGAVERESRVARDPDFQGIVTDFGDIEFVPALLVGEARLEFTPLAIHVTAHGTPGDRANGRAGITLGITAALVADHGAHDGADHRARLGAAVGVIGRAANQEDQRGGDDEAAILLHGVDYLDRTREAGNYPIKSRAIGHPASHSCRHPESI